MNRVDHLATMKPRRGRLPEARCPPANGRIAGHQPLHDRARQARPSDAASKVRGAVADEVIVVDTETADGTATVARAHGATVVEASLADDFAAARNVALERARGPDSDSTADGAAGGHARAAARRRRHRRGWAGFIETCGQGSGRQCSRGAACSATYRRIATSAGCASACASRAVPPAADPAPRLRRSRAVRGLGRNRMLLSVRSPRNPAEPLLRYYLAATCLLTEHDETIPLPRDSAGPGRAPRRAQALPAGPQAHRRGLARNGGGGRAAWTGGRGLSRT